MGCSCSKASQPGRLPTLLEHRHQSALPQAKPTDTEGQATTEDADVNVPSSVSGRATPAESSLKPDVAMPVLEGELEIVPGFVAEHRHRHRAWRVGSCNCCG